MSVKATLSLDPSQFEKGIARAVQSTQMLSSILSGIVGAIAGAFSVQKIRGFVDEMSRLVDLSTLLGISVETMQRLDFAAKKAGASGEVVARAMATLGASLQGGDVKVVKALEDLGINAKEFAKLDADQKLIALARGMERAGGSSEAINSALGVLGVRSRDLVPLLAQGGDALEKTLQQAKVVSEGTARTTKAMVEEIDAVLNNLRVPILNATKSALTGLVSVIGLIGVLLQKIGELEKKISGVPTGVLSVISPAAGLLRALNPTEAGEKMQAFASETLAAGEAAAAAGQLTGGYVETLEDTGDSAEVTAKKVALLKAEIAQLSAAMFEPLGNRPIEARLTETQKSIAEKTKQLEQTEDLEEQKGLLTELVALRKQAYELETRLWEKADEITQTQREREQLLRGELSVGEALLQNAKELAEQEANARGATGVEEKLNAERQINKLLEKRTELEKKRADINKEIAELEKQQAEASAKSAEQKTREARLERASSTLGEIAGAGRGEASPAARNAARRVMALEARAKRARAFGQDDTSVRLMEQADNLRGKIAGLSASEKDPMMSLNETLSEQKKLQENIAEKLAELKASIAG